MDWHADSREGRNKTKEQECSVPRGARRGGRGADSRQADDWCVDFSEMIGGRSRVGTLRSTSLYEGIEDVAQRLSSKGKRDGTDRGCVWSCRGQHHVGPTAIGSSAGPLTGRV